VKRFLVLVVVLAICLVTGCIGEVKSYDDPGQTIDIGVNQEFVIALGSNPTTGYSWQASYDETMLELVGGHSKYKEEAKKGLVGAGGVECFQFKALKSARTIITMVYKKLWEESTPQDLTKVFTIHIR
jgi:inhibitor of cysteine peptidase